MNTVYAVLAGFATWSALCVFLGWRLGSGDRKILAHELKEEQEDHEREVATLTRKIAAQGELLVAYRARYDDTITLDRVLYDHDEDGPADATPGPDEAAPSA